MIRELKGAELIFTALIMLKGEEGTAFSYYTHGICEECAEKVKGGLSCQKQRLK